MKVVAIFITALIAGALCSGCASKPFIAAKVSEGIYDGYKPKTQAHFDLLKTNGVHTILSLQTRHFHTDPEAKDARRNGFVFLDVPIPPAPWQPEESNVRAVLECMNDRFLQPIYVHCLLGMDRTALIIGLYRMYYQDWTPDAAWQEMLHNGFHTHWSLLGLQHYFWQHTETPEWVKGSSYSEVGSNRAAPLDR